MNIRNLLKLFCLALLSTLLVSCAEHGPGLSLGIGSHGAGVGLHSGYGWYPGFGYAGGGFWGRRHSGVFVGFPVGYVDHGGSGSYSSGRIVHHEPGRAPITEESHADWNRYDSLYHSPLPYYRGQSFLTNKRR